MKRFLLSILFFVGIVNLGLGQDFIAVQDGDWNDGATWGNTSPGTEGVDWPGSGDDVAVDGFSIALPRNQNFSCNTLFFQFNIADQLTIKGGRGALPTLTIEEAIIADDGFPNFIPTAPNTQLFNSNIDFTFTGEKLTGFSGINTILGPWSTNCEFGEVIISQLGAESVKLEEILPIGNSIEVTTGLFEIRSGGTAAGVGASAEFNLNAGTTLTVNGNINGDGSNTSVFNTINLLGDVTTGTSGYINADNITLGSGSTFTINFNGANQTQGWWYQTTGPTGTFDLDPTSVVIYNASTNQNVAAIEYGYLRLRSPSGTSTKTLQSSGNLLVQNLMRLNSANVTFDTSPNPNPVILEGNLQNIGNWSPSQRVIFSGTTAQSINGSNEITFAGGIRVSNTLGLTLNNIGVDIDNELDIDPSCSFDPSDQVVTMSGNFRVDGDLIAGTSPGRFLFDGTTEFLGSGNNAFYNLDIDASGTLIASSGAISVERNWTNNGVFDNNLGTVVFANTDPVSVSGSSTTSFYDLSLEGGTVNINGTVDLENVMSFVGSPTVDFDGSGSGVFTLLSSETRDAAIANVGTATLDGNMNIQRAIYTVGGDGRGYHIMGFPVSGLTVAEIQDEMSVTGPFTGASTCPTSNCTYSIYAFDENAAGNGVFDDGYSGFPSSNNGESFTNGEGYYIFNYSGEPASGIIEGSGSVFSGDFSTTLSRTGASSGSGWHMVSNPYPAPTDWSQWDRSNIEGGSAYLYNPSSGSYELLDGSVQQLIPQGQGFFVRALSNGVSLSATEATKVTGTTPTYYRTLPQERFEIILKTPDYDDKTIVSFNQEATDNYEPKYDAIRLLNTYETLSTLTADEEMVKLNRLAPVTNSENCSRVIKLNLEQMVVGDDYSLDFNEINTINTQELILKDNFLNTESQITDDFIYNFQVTNEAASKGFERFEIVLNSNQPNQISTVSSDVCPQQNASILLQNTESFVNYLVTDGNEVIANVEGTGSDANVEITQDLLHSSINEFMIQAYVSGCDTTTVGSAQVQVYEELLLNQEVNGSSICSGDNEAAFSLDTQTGASYYILDGQDTIQTVEGTGSVFDGMISIKDLNSGLNEFVVAAEKDECQSGTIEQTLDIIYQDLVIDKELTFETNATCFDNSASIDFTGQADVTYNVYKSGNLLSSLVSDGTQQSILIDKTNLVVGKNEFTIEATYGSCAEYEFTDKVIINVEEQIIDELAITNANSCGTSSASVVINNAQEGKIYNLKSGEETVVSKMANQDGELAIEVPAVNLIEGLNQFNILIEGQNCASLTANQLVEVNYVESAIIDSIEDYTICLNDSLSIDLSANVDILNFQLYLGEELVKEESGTRLTIAPQETATYTLTGTTAEACEVNSINFTVEVTDLSKPGILVSDNVLESSIKGDRYQWYLDGEKLAEETNKLIVVSETGNYTVEVTKGNCSSISDVFTFDQEILKTNELLENSVNFYPNPVSEKMFVEISNINSVNITIFTLEGKFIDSFKLNESQTEIDMAMYSKGTYLIQFESEKGSFTKRLIKQ